MYHKVHIIRPLLQQSWQVLPISQRTLVPVPSPASQGCQATKIWEPSGVLKSENQIINLLIVIPAPGGGRQIGRTEAENSSSSSRCRRAMSCSYRAATNLGCITTLETMVWVDGDRNNLLVNPSNLRSLELVLNFQKVAHYVQTERNAIIFHLTQDSQIQINHLATPSCLMQ